MFTFWHVRQIYLYGKINKYVYSDLISVESFEYLYHPASLGDNMRANQSQNEQHKHVSHDKTIAFSMSNNNNCNTCIKHISLKCQAQRRSKQTKLV